MEAKCELYGYEKHYSMLAAWWRAHRLPPIPRDQLSRLGAVAYLDRVPRAAVWAYKGEDVPLGWLGFALTNPANTPRQSAAALEIAMEAATYLLAQAGVRIIQAGYGTRGLSNILEKQGFICAAEGVREMIKVVTREEVQ